MSEKNDALSALQDARDAANRLAEDGYADSASTILTAIALADAQIVELEKVLTQALHDRDYYAAKVNGTPVPEARETIYTAAHLVPTSWLDPLLTGDDAVLKGSGPWGCPDIERLLNAIRERIATAQETPSPQRLVEEKK